MEAGGLRGNGVRVLTGSKVWRFRLGFGARAKDFRVTPRSGLGKVHEELLG